MLVIRQKSRQTLGLGLEQLRYCSSYIISLQPCVTYINRVEIWQRLLVKFSCDPHINSLLRALLATTSLV